MQPPREEVPGRGPALHAPGGSWSGAALTHINELLLLLLGHLAEAVVPARQVPGEATQCIHSHFLNLSSLGTGAGWRQAQATDAAPSPDPGREHIALIKLAKLYLEHTAATGCSWGGPGAGRALPPRPKEGHCVQQHCPASAPLWRPGLWCVSWCGGCIHCAAPGSRGQTGQQTPGSK